MPGKRYLVVPSDSYAAAVKRLVKIARTLKDPVISPQLLKHQQLAEKRLEKFAAKRYSFRVYFDGRAWLHKPKDVDVSGLDWNYIYYHTHSRKKYKYGNVIELETQYKLCTSSKLVILTYIDIRSIPSDSIDRSASEAAARVAAAIQRVDEGREESGSGLARPSPVAEGYRVGPFSFMQDGSVRDEERGFNLTEVINFRELEWDGYSLSIDIDSVYSIYKLNECDVRMQFDGRQWLLIERRDC